MLCMFCKIRGVFDPSCA